MEQPIQWLKRHSVRAFMPDPVPNEVLQRVVNAAIWSPSWANSQPWKIIVVSGETKQELCSAFIAKAEKGESATPDLPVPKAWPGEMQHRIREHAKNRSRFAGISKEDQQGRFAFQLKMYR